MAYQHVLIAVDLSEECHPVLQRALELAGRDGARVSLIHVIEPMAMAFGGDVPKKCRRIKILKNKRKSPGNPSVPGDFFMRANMREKQCEIRPR